MKSNARYIIIAAALLALVSMRPVLASEISGTLSTGGDTSGTDTGSGNGTTTDTGGTTSTTTDTTGGNTNNGGLGNGGTIDVGDISGEVTGGTTNTTDTTDTSNSSSNTNTNTASNTPAPIVGWVSSSFTPVINPNDTTTATTTATTTQGISDEELARLAMVNFGPRYGVSSVDFTPGAPDAGGPGIGSGNGSYNSLSVGSGSNGGAVSDTPSLDASGYPSPFAYLPRTGEGPVIPDANQSAGAANAVGATGLSIPQLLLVALVGLLLLGSVGYAISSTNKHTSRAV